MVACLYPSSTDRNGIYLMNYFDIVDKYMRERMPEFEWSKFYDLDQFINMNLWHGPEVSGYFEDNPLDYMPESFEAACEELTEMIGQLPPTLYIDDDAECVYGETSPEEDMDSWGDVDNDETFGTHWEYFGPSFSEVEVPRVLLYKEVYSHCV